MADIAQIQENNPKTEYERSDWPISTVGLVYLGTFIFLVIAPFVLLWVYSSAMSEASRRLLVRPPAPELQIDPAADLAKLRASEDKRLNTYYWVNKDKGIVHIPIRQAMEKIAKSGIDGFPKGRP
jgi:hypothetical protein